MEASIIAIIIAIIAIVPGVGALINNRRVIAQQDKKVDAQAYLRAQKIYDQTLSQVESQLANLREENARLVAANRSLQIQLFELEKTVARMRRQLIELGINPGGNDV